MTHIFIFSLFCGDMDGEEEQDHLWMVLLFLGGHVTNALPWVRWQWKWRLGDNPQDNLTADVTTASQLVRLRCFRQRQNGGNYRLDRACVEEGSDLGQLRAVGLGQHPGSTHAPGRDCLLIDLCRCCDQDAARLEDSPR